MNTADLASHFADGISTTRASAERMVGAVFFAIAEALARDEPAAIGGFGKFAVRSRAARQRRNPRTGEPVAVPASKVPSSSRRKPLATRSTNSMMGRAVTCSLSVLATRKPRVRTIEPQICKSSFLAPLRRPTLFPSRTVAPQSIHTRLVTDRFVAEEISRRRRSVESANTCATARGHRWPRDRRRHLRASRRLGIEDRGRNVDLDETGIVEALHHVPDLGITNVTFVVTNGRIDHSPRDRIDTLYSPSVIDHGAHPYDVIARMNTALLSRGCIAEQRFDFPDWQCSPLSYSPRRPFWHRSTSTPLQDKDNYLSLLVSGETYAKFSQ